MVHVYSAAEQQALIWYQLLLTTRWWYDVAFTVSRLEVVCSWHIQFQFLLMLPWATCEWCDCQLYSEWEVSIVSEPVIIHFIASPIEFFTFMTSPKACLWASPSWVRHALWHRIVFIKSYAVSFIDLSLVIICRFIQSEQCGYSNEYIHSTVALPASQ